MKILQKMAFGGDWGCFLWKDMPAGYKAGAEQSIQKNEYQNLWDKTKKQLEGLSDTTVLNGVSIEKPFDSTGKTLISTQLATMLNETGSWGTMKDYQKTKFLMKRLTEMGLKINNPKDFIGKTLIIENGEIQLEGAVNNTSATVVDTKEKKKAAKDEVVVVDDTKETNTETTSLEKDITKVKEEAVKAREAVEAKLKTDLDPSEKTRLEKEKKLLDNMITEYDKQINEIKKKKGEKLVENEVIEETDEEEINLTTAVISKDFLIESTTAEEEKKVLEPTMAEIKKTPEQIVVLQTELDQVNHDFAEVEAVIQTALEGQFDKGKLKDKTPAQIEDLIKDNEKYKNIYTGLIPSFEQARVLEERKKYLAAVVAVDALYDVDDKYKYQSRYDVTEEDVVDAKTEDKTVFGQRYEAAEGALQDLEGKTVENQGLFDEMRHGYERSRLVAQSKVGMTELAALESPEAGDFPKIQTIKAQITEARTHGAVNDMFEEGVLIELLQKERRSSHMQAKEDAELAYADVPEEYIKDLSQLTEKKLEDADISGLITILSTAMTHPLNKAKDPEVVKKAEGDENAETWDKKHLDQGTADGIEALILRREQLEKSLQYSSEFGLLFPSNHSILAKERKQGKDKTWLSIENVENFQKLEKNLNKLLPLYLGEQDASLLQADLERQYGNSFTRDLSRARENVLFRLNQPDMKNHERVKPKVEVEDDVLQFDKLEKSEGSGEGASEGTESGEIEPMETHEELMEEGQEMRERSDYGAELIGEIAREDDPARQKELETELARTLAFGATEHMDSGRVTMTGFSPLTFRTEGENVIVTQGGEEYTFSKEDVSGDWTPRIEIEPEVAVEPEIIPEVEIEPEVVVEPEIIPEVETKPEVAVEPEIIPEMEIEPEVVVEPEVIPETVIALGMAAVKDFWESDGLSSLAGEISKQKLEKTLSYLSVEEQANGDKKLVYQTKPTAKAYYLTVEDPEKLILDLQTAEEKNVAVVGNYWRNSATALLSLSAGAEDQPWLEILGDLASDVKLSEVEGNTLTFERKRREQVGDRVGMVQTTFLVEAMDDGQYVLDKIVKIQRQEKITNDRKDKILTKVALLDWLNGEYLNEEEE